MDNIRLNEILYKDAKTLCACDKVMSAWNHPYTTGELISLFRNNQEFCIEKDFPSVAFITSNFSSKELKDNNVYINEDGFVLDGVSGICVVGGSSSGAVISRQFGTATLYIRHNANIEVTADDFSKLFINVYDNANVAISCDTLASVYVYNYSPAAKIICDERIKIRTKY